MPGYTVNTRGRYKCQFCDHRTYKHQSGVVTHLEQHHQQLYAMAQENAALQSKYDANSRALQRLKDQPPKVVEKERVVYRDPPAKKETKYWYIKNGGGIYCETCKTVQMGVGIPEGQTIENTPHTCGNRTLKLVLEVR